MDGTNMLANMMPSQGDPNPGGGNQAGPNGICGPSSADALPKNSQANQFMNSHNNGNDNNGGNPFASGGGGMNNSMGAMQGMTNPNSNGMHSGMSSVMNAVLMNNALQQQQQQQQGAQGGMGGMMNPLVLQSMMNQGMMGNPFANNGAQQMGMNSLLQQGMMNHGMAGMMGGMGMGGGMGGTNPSAPGANHNSGNMAPSSLDNKAPSQTSNNSNNETLAQLMQNPMAAQLMAQGMNPMMLLQGMGQNQMGAGDNSSGALARNNGADAASAGLYNPEMRNANTGDGISQPRPNALFGYNNAGSMPQDSNAFATMGGDGVLKAPVANTSGKTGKGKGKKAKVKGKPKRPLSAYNFFFRAERARILDTMSQAEEKSKKSINTEEEAESADDVKEEDEGKKKGKGDKDYDQVGNDGKKIPHGKIGFENLAKLIGKRWKELDAEGVEKYKQLADEDMIRYKKAMQVFSSKGTQVQASMDGELMDPSFYIMLNQKREGGIDDDDVMKPKKKKQRSKTIKNEPVEL